MKRAAPYIMLLPVFILVCMLLVSLADSVLQSLGYFPAAGLTSFTFAYYKEVLGSLALRDSLLYSLYLSLVSALLSVALGVALSALLHASARAEALVYRLPIAMPHIVVAFLVIALLSQTGLLARLAYALGLIGEPGAFPLLTQDKAGAGVIAAYVFKQAPYVMSVVVLLMRRVSSTCGEAARVLGASPRKAFFYVTLPLCMPAVSTAFIIVFAYSFGAYELPFLLGATLPRAFPVQAYTEFLSPSLLHRPYAMVYNALMLLFGVIFIALYLVAFKRLMRYNKAVYA
ncbi:MAG: ABC transporter permease subunit [Christensenellaceae bacterium]|jgi:putative spermidine/putrescine transport system permease protein|nr:ABC transporter permease subunit [Christensenellaceae bacterium]